MQLGTTPEQEFNLNFLNNPAAFAGNNNSRTPERKDTKNKQIIEDYKNKYAEKLQQLTDSFNFKLKEKDIGFDTRLAEMTEEYELRMVDFRNRIRKYRKLFQY